MKWTSFLMLSALAFQSAGAQQSDTVRLHELIVTAAKLPQPRAATTAAVTVLDGNHLRARGLRTVAEALRETPSAMLVQSGSQGAITSLFLRGGESDYVQVLVDGVRVNNPGGQYDFSNLTLDNIDRIEVVRGPVSVLYGSDAVTGVVQIFTRRGTENRARIGVGGGGGARVTPDSLPADHYLTRSINVDASGSRGRLSYSAGVGQQGSAGLYAFNNEYRNNTASARGGLALSANTDLSWSGRFTDSRYHYPTDGSGRLVDRNAQRATEAFVTGAELHARPANNIDASLRAGLSHNDERYIDLPDAPADTLGTYSATSVSRLRRAFVELNGNYHISSSTIVSAGGELEQQRDRDHYDSQSQFGPFNSKFGKDRTNRGVYLQLIKSMDVISLNGGLRRDANDRFGDFITYRAGVSLRPGTNTRVRFAAGTAFKEPTFFENYAQGFTRGNPHLQPEHSRSWEVGIEQMLPNNLGHVQVTHFQQRFRDLIQYVPRDFTSTEPNYENIAAARANGVEAELQLNLRALQATAAFSTLSTKALDADQVEDPQFEPGLPLIRRPEQQGSIMLTYTQGSLQADARWLYVGKRADLDFSSFPFARVMIEPYHRFDVGAAYRLTNYRSAPLSITGRVENVFDREYEEVLGFPAKRRTLWLGVETSLGW